MPISCQTSGLLSPPMGSHRDAAEACDNFGLDFDGAYQYVAARNRGLKIAAMDEDFETCKIDFL